GSLFQNPEQVTVVVRPRRQILSGGPRSAGPLVQVIGHQTPIGCIYSALRVRSAVYQLNLFLKRYGERFHHRRQVQMSIRDVYGHYPSRAQMAEVALEGLSGQQVDRN